MGLHSLDILLLYWLMLPETYRSSEHVYQESVYLRPISKQRYLSLWSLLEGDGSLLIHGSDDTDNQVLAVVELGSNLVTQFTIWDLDIVLGVTVGGHQRQKTIVNVQQLVFGSAYEGNVHVVGGWRQVLQLLAGENVNGDQVDLGVTVLTSLGSRHVDNLTRSALDDNVTVLSQCRALHWIGQSGAGISGLKRVLDVSTGGKRRVDRKEGT